MENPGKLSYSISIRNFAFALQGHSSHITHYLLCKPSSDCKNAGGVNKNFIELIVVLAIRALDISFVRAPYRTGKVGKLDLDHFHMANKMGQLGP